MKTTINTLMIGACLSMSVGMTQAATITHGNLSYDNTGQIIQDSLNDRNWIDFEGTGLTFSNLVTATQAGGAWEGWNIANNSDALLFVDALLGGASTCVSTTVNSVCGNRSGWVDDSLGASYSSSYDYFFFENTAGASDLGFVELLATNGRVQLWNSWSSFSSGDNYVNGTSPINYLIWQSATPAPAPAAGLLMATAVMGLFYRRRKTPASH